MGAEKRKYPRFKIDQMIEINLGRESFVHASGKNLSEGGILCESDDPIEPYSHIYLMIGIIFDEEEDERLLKVEGVTLRCVEEEDGSYSIGVKFTDLSESDRQLLREYLSKSEVEPA